MGVHMGRRRVECGVCGCHCEVVWWGSFLVAPALSFCCDGFLKFDLSKAPSSRELSRLCRVDHKIGMPRCRAPAVTELRYGE